MAFWFCQHLLDCTSDDHHTTYIRYEFTEFRYDNWVAAMVDWREIEHSQEWHDWVQKAFDAFDVDGSGSIGIQDLQTMLCQGAICAVSRPP